MLFFKKKTTPVPLEERLVPQNLGIIMDGNGRWARKRGLPRQAGHVTGAQTFRKITKYCERCGIRYLTVYAFSTENWKRPQEEVDAIMNLLHQYLRESLADFQKENIRVRFIGDRAPLAEDIRQLMEEAEESTAHKEGMTLNIALNYGGQQEITAAARRLAERVQAGEITPADVTEESLQQALYTEDQPPVDLILRPSGEYRLSNFLIWQSAYAEFVFMEDILWPDFKESDLERAFAEFARRNRRFGGV
ncbi:MAG: isoprenyl transferase [Ruminococcaceae bacterium]|nr:isoprenyl transferase [Oscillospiraceae bacterium]